MVKALDDGSFHLTSLQLQSQDEGEAMRQLDDTAGRMGGILKGANFPD